MRFSHRGGASRVGLIVLLGGLALLGTSTTGASSAGTAASPQTSAVQSEPEPRSSIAPAVPEAASDPQLIETRAKFGFPTDAESMARAVRDTLKRSPDPDPIGAPLTNAELRAVQDYDNTGTARQDLTEFLANHHDTAASWLFNHDLDDPHATIQITSAFSAADLAQMKALIPAGWEYSIAVVEYPASEVAALAASVEGELRGHAGNGDVKSARDLGMSPLRAEFIDSDQFVTLIVRGSGEGRSDEELTALLAKARTIKSGPAIKVVRGDEEVSANGRLDSPGQAKGGIRVEVCTLAGSAAIGVERYVFTAGHCTKTTVIHSAVGGATNGGTSYGPTQFSANSDGTSTAWALDYRFAKLSADKRGLASPHFMTVSSTTGGASYSKYTGTKTTLEAVGDYVCYEGASQLRVTYSIFTTNHFRTLCGFVIDSHTTSGRVQVDVKVCKGDSGGPVRSGSILYGIVSRHTNFIPGTGVDCGYYMSYARIQQQLTAIGATLVTDHTGMLRNEQDKCVSAAGSGLANGTPYIQYACLYLPPGYTTPHPAQSFFLEPIGGGSSDRYRLIRMNGSTKTCLSLDGNSAGSGYANGALTIVYECLGSSHPLQNWLLRYAPVTANDGRFNLLSEGANPPIRCLSIPGNLTTDVQLHIWDCYGSANSAQLWRIR